MIRISKISLYRLIVLSIALIAVLSGIAEAKNTPRTTFVEVMGTGVIVEDDDASARDLAISNSLVSAVGMVVSETLSLDLLVQNFQAINKLFFDHTDQFILGYKVMTETKHGNLYRVIVRARVSDYKIKNQLNKAGFIISQKAMPKVLFLIAQRNINEISTLYWWGDEMPNVINIAETAMGEIIQKKGLIVVHHERKIEFPEGDAVILEPDIDNTTAVAFGKLFNADIVIAGNATADLASNTMGDSMQSFNGTVTARAVKVSTGLEIGSTKQTNLTVNTNDIAGGTEAITGAGYIAGEELAMEIAAAWHSEEKKSTKIEIIVEGTGYLANFVKFRRVINDMPGVVDLQSKTMKSDEAVIIVDYQGDSKKMARALMLKTFDTFGVNITKVTADSILISLVTRNRMQF